MDQQKLKKTAAAKALEFVKDGMVLGLGSGSTAGEFVKQLANKVRDGELKNIVGIPTSEATGLLAEENGIKLASLDDHEKIDLAIDGADEVDPDLQLIKGLGKALLREKMTEIHAEKFIVIVDASKVVKKLGEKCPLPVEIVPFAYGSTINFFNSLPGCKAELWLEDNDEPTETDNGNYLAKCYFEKGIDDPHKIGEMLAGRPGVVEHGLFLDMASKVIVAEESGIQIMEK